MIFRPKIWRWRIWPQWRLRLNPLPFQETGRFSGVGNTSRTVFFFPFESESRFMADPPSLGWESKVRHPDFAGAKLMWKRRHGISPAFAEFQPVAATDIPGLWVNKTKFRNISRFFEKNNLNVFINSPNFHDGNLNQASESFNELRLRFTKCWPSKLPS